ENPDQNKNRARARTRETHSGKPFSRQFGIGRIIGSRTSGSESRSRDRYQRASRNRKRVPKKYASSKDRSKGLRRKDQQTAEAIVAGQDQGSSSRSRSSVEQRRFQSWRPRRFDEDGRRGFEQTLREIRRQSARRCGYGRHEPGPGKGERAQGA